MPRLLVVGAGLAGLAAAHRASELGCDVELIEAAGRPGGALLAVDRLRVPIATWEQLRARGAPAEAGLEPAPTALPAPASPRRAAPAWSRWLPARARRRIAELVGSPPAAAPARPAPPPSVLVDGPALARSLAAPLSVRVGWEVLEVATREDAALLTYLAPSGERSLTADAVILATPAASLPRLVPSRSRELRAAVEASSIQEAVAVQFGSPTGSGGDGPPPRVLPSDPERLSPVLIWAAWLAEGCVYAELVPGAAETQGGADDRALALSLAQVLAKMGEPVDSETARVARWADPVLPSDAPDSEGRLFWVRRGPADLGVAGALEAGSRAAEQAAKTAAGPPAPPTPGR